VLGCGSTPVRASHSAIAGSPSSTSPRVVISPWRRRQGRFNLAFNGEISNHLDLRRRAEDAGHRVWRGHSDTESLLAHIELFGLEHTLKESVGMFAIALWDRKHRMLHLARDRMGEKPLY